METARRPLFAAALALCAGSALGAEAECVGVALWRAAAAAALVATIAALAARGLGRGPDGGADGGSSHGSGGTSGRQPGCGSGRAAGCALVALLAALGGWRARLEATAPFAAEGTFQEGRTLDGTVRGALRPGRLEVEVPAGTVADGEGVRIVGGTPASEPARGPVAGPPPRGDGRRVAALPDEVVRLAPAHGGAARLDGALARLRAALLARLLAVRDPEARGLAAALVFGEVGALPEELPDLFLRTGTYHALAVSGIQVVLVAALILGPAAAGAAALARAFGARAARWTRELVRVGALCLYVPLAGGGPPVVRAALACALARAAPFAPAAGTAVVTAHGRSAQVVLPRRADGLALWSLALLVECALHPRAGADLSVQLSYAATLGLVVATAPLRRRLTPAPPAATDALGRPRPALARAVAWRAARFGSSALSASLAAVLATLPFVWARVGEWSPLGVLATIAIAPPMLVLLVGGWVAALVPGLVPEPLLALAARALVATLRAFDALPGTPEPLPPRPAALVAACVLAAFAALILADARARRRAARAAALGAGLLLLPWTCAPRGFELHALDVGGGTCCVARAPGLGTWVFDAGSRSRSHVGRAALGPLLRAWDVGTLGVVVSHDDRDHHAALPWLLGRWPAQVLAGALPAQVAERLPHTALRLDVAAGRAALPALQGSCSAAAAWIERGAEGDGNEGSRSLRLRWCGEEVLLTGDAEEDGLRGTLALDAAPRPVRVLLAPHHGSDVERLGALLGATRPAEVWISGPADAPIAAELTRRGVAWRATGRDGPLALALEGAREWNGACNPGPP